jgi:hypothetical protein
MYRVQISIKNKSVLNTPDHNFSVVFHRKLCTQFSLWVPFYHFYRGNHKN